MRGANGNLQEAIDVLGFVHKDIGIAVPGSIDIRVTAAGVSNCCRTREASRDSNCWMS